MNPRLVLRGNRMSCHLVCFIALQGCTFIGRVFGCFIRLVVISLCFISSIVLESSACSSKSLKQVKKGFKYKFFDPKPQYL